MQYIYWKIIDIKGRIACRNEARFLNARERAGGNMEQTKLILIRHGQSMGNLNEILLGHTDLGLSPLGVSEAQLAADYFRDEKIDFIYSSSLKRACETALPFSKMHGIEIHPQDELREIYLGEWEGAELKKIRETEEYSVQWKLHFGEACTPGGESVRHAGERFYDAVLKIAKEHLGSTVLITAHAAVIRCFWGIISEIPFAEIADALPFPDNASASICIFDGEKIVPQIYSFSDYLKK